MFRLTLKYAVIFINAAYAFRGDDVSMFVFGSLSLQLLVNMDKLIG